VALKRAAKRLSKVIWVFSMLFACTALGARQNTDALTCGEMEKYAFAVSTPSWFFTNPANRPAPQGAVLAPDATMGDGVTLRGLVVPASQPTDRRKALLVLYGILVYSDLFHEMLKPLGVYDSHYDTYIYDYRGYWRSDGRPRFRAMVDDVGELLAVLGERYDEIRIYGVSLGALIASRVAADDEKVTSIFLDGVVSRLATLAKNCETGRLDPVDMSETTCRKITLLVGRYDSVFPPELAEPVIERMNRCGNAHVTILTDLGHPFSEGLADGPWASSLRGTIIREWLANDSPQKTSEMPKAAVAPWRTAGIIGRRKR
jgi:pimeloyl-ACP methyl ester carboxylesterase